MEDLQKKFGSDTVSFERGVGNFIYVKVKNANASALICTYGAHVMSYKPAGAYDCLWLSESSYFEAGKPIRGGVPVCWPWFGGAVLPAHGYARLSQWAIRSVGKTAGGDDQIVLELNNQLLAPGIEVFSFELTMTVTVGKKLTMTLTTTNRDSKTVEITQALHSYFNVANAMEISIKGLEERVYFDRIKNADGVCGDELKIDREVDLLFPDTADTVKIVDPELNRTIEVAKQGSHSTVVWNPWVEKSKKMPDFGDEEYHTMVCVEATNAGPDKVVLAPGQSTSLTQIIGIAK